MGRCASLFVVCGEDAPLRRRIRGYKSADSDRKFVAEDPSRLRAGLRRPLIARKAEPLERGRHLLRRLRIGLRLKRGIAESAREFFEHSVVLGPEHI